MYTTHKQSYPTVGSTQTQSSCVVVGYKTNCLLHGSAVCRPHYVTHKPFFYIVATGLRKRWSYFWRWAIQQYLYPEGSRRKSRSFLGDWNTCHTAQCGIFILLSINISVLFCPPSHSRPHDQLSTKYHVPHAVITCIVSSSWWWAK